jgi:hypothetical protein
MKLDNSMIFKGTNDIVLRKTESLQTNGNSVLRKLGDVYSEFAKLVFCFDVSGSMSERIAADKNKKGFADQYLWTPERLASIRAKVADAIAVVMSGQDLGWEQQEIIKMIDPLVPGMPPTFTVTDEEIKTRVIQHDLIGSFHVAIDWSKPHMQPPSRIELVAKLAKQEIEARFAKFPQSSLAVIAFGAGAKVVFDSGTADEVRAVVDRIQVGMDSVNSGGTDIMASIRAGVECCRKHPSSVGLHHFIVVSDGGDSGTNVLPEWVPVLKQSGIILDYIHIGDENPNDALKAACAALGGECVVVNTEAAFETKFVEAVHRLCLPPASV